MPRFLMTYRGPKGYVPTPDTRSLWHAWFDGMGDALADLGNPTAQPVSVGNCSSDSTELNGFSVIDAEDLDAALLIANGCPHLQWNGGVEIGLLIDVPPRR